MKLLEFKIIALMSIPFLLIGLRVLDETLAPTQVLKGVVIDKQYVSGDSGSSLGVVSSPSGNAGVVLHLDGPEEFILIVEDGGVIESVSCDTKLYYAKSIGDTLTYHLHRGFITGLKIKNKGLK